MRLPDPPGERNHLLFVVAFSFLAGCLSILYLSGGAWLWLLAGIGLLLGILLRRLGCKATAGVVLCCFALGALHANGALVTPQPVPGQYTITGTVSGGSRLRTDQRITFTLVDIRLDDQPVHGSAYCSLHYDAEPPLLFDGAQVRFHGRVYLPDGRSGAPHADFRLWMHQHGLSFGIAAYQQLELLNTLETAPITDAAYRVREWIGGIYRRFMGDESRIAMALVLGERNGLTEAEYSSFQELGIAHVMSVSGLHVGIIGSIMLWLMQRFPLKRRVQLVLLTLFLAGYCMLTGAAAPSIRASVMLLTYHTAALRRRRADRITVISLALLVVLLLQPLQASGAGFILSFSAIAGIALYMKPLQQWMNERFPSLQRQPWRALHASLCLTLCAQLGVLIPTAAFFHQLPLYGVLINLLIVPLVSAVLVPLYLLLLPASLLPAAGSFIGAIAALITKCMLQLVQLLSHLPYAAIRVAKPPLALSLSIGLALAMLSTRAPGSVRRRLLTALLALTVGVSSALLSRPADLRYIQIAAGQADCALLLDGDATILIDAGNDGDHAVDYLQDECRDVDALILTHLHLDHAGGVEQIINADIPIHQVYLPEGARRQQVDDTALALLNRLEAEGIPITELASGDELRYNKAAIRVLWPVEGRVRSGHDANDFPLVTVIDLDGYTLLNASDLTGAYEPYAAVPADVLKVSHHGDAAATSDAFLSHVSPRFALISCSSGSKRLPGAAVLERLEEHGVLTLRTDLDGDITLSVEDGILTVTPYKVRITP